MEIESQKRSKEYRNSRWWKCKSSAFTSNMKLSPSYNRLSSVQFTRSVMSNSLWPHESQHARPPCPSPTPRVHSRLISIKSVMPSSHLILCRPFSHPQSLPASESFPMSQLFAWGGHSTGVSALASSKFYQMFGEELMPIPLKLFQKFAQEGIFNKLILSS